jgi:hypothetical protein
MYFGSENPFTGLSHFDSRDLPDAVQNCIFQMTGKRTDANETFFFARELEYVYTKTFDILRPELKVRSLIPVDTSPPSGADSFTYSQFDKMGEARIVHNYAQDFPNVEVKGTQFKQGIYSLGDSYQYTIQDLRAAQMAGRPLETKKAEAARYAIDLKLEVLGAIGDKSTGLIGLVNAPNIGQFTKVSQNNAGSTAATYASLISDALAKGNIGAIAQEIVKDFNGMRAQVFNTTLGVHEIDTFVLPSDIYSLLNTTQMAPSFGDKTTILQYILGSAPEIKSIEYWVQLNTCANLAPTPGSAGHGLIMGYAKNPDVLNLIISQEFEQFAPQPRGMALIVPCHMRTGAVEVRYPKAVICMTGAD